MTNLLKAFSPISCGKHYNSNYLGINIFKQGNLKTYSEYLSDPSKDCENSLK
jgi:hypothetical protein